ncbi:MAG: hypothetical protein WD096_04230 [Actinomycetota bacterium]
MAFKYLDGLIIYFYPEGRSEQRFVEDVQEQASAEGSDWPFTLIQLRGRPAEAAERREANGNIGPAAISWIEEGYLISLIGHGGETLADLVGIAEAMTQARAEPLG